MSVISKFFNIIVGVIFIAFGIYLWGNPAETLVTYSLYLGLTYVAGSIVVLTYILIKKIKPVPWGNILVSFIIGFTILSLPILSLTFILWIFIIGFLITAIYSFIRVYKEKGKYHILQLTLSILAIAYGIIMMVRPIVGANTMAKIIAAFVVFNGVSYIFPSLEKQNNTGK